jgi:hypothetical protein
MGYLERWGVTDTGYWVNLNRESGVMEHKVADEYLDGKTNGNLLSLGRDHGDQGKFTISL